jgi:amidophosphoribosyltransferase
LTAKSFLHLLAQPESNGTKNHFVHTLRTIEGAYSLVIMTEKELIGARDPFGFRPLCIGKLGDAYVLSSETCALDLIHAKFVRDVEPGEIVIINEQGLTSIQAFPEQTKRAFCIFEYVYFARPDSNIATRNVYKVRVDMGRQLAREFPIQADVVVPVPDSGNCAALGYSLESGIPFEMAFVRNHYVGRSFLQPSQLIRDFNVRVKLNLITRPREGQAGHRRGRFHCARHDLQGTREQFERGRREGSPCARQLPAAHEPVRLWD